MHELMNVTRALGDENRVRILGALSGRELCVCQIVLLLRLAPSTVSKHLSILRQARLIEPRRQGRWIYYALAAEDAPPEATSALDWLLERLESEPRMVADELRLKEILAMDLESLCGIALHQRDEQGAELESVRSSRE